MMLAASVSFIACAFPLSPAWFFAWRFASGFAGAVAMVPVAQTILPLGAPARHGFASGAIFMGIGAGVIASGTVISPLLQYGLAACWIASGAVSLILTAATWRAWPADATAVASARPSPPAVRLLCVEYAAVAVGLVPDAVFLVDFVARGLHQGAVHRARYWILYGAGALCGPIAYGAVAERIGFRNALRAGLLLSGAASMLLAMQHADGSIGFTHALAAASVLLGACTPGMVSLMIGRLPELLRGDHPAQQAG